MCGSYSGNKEEKVQLSNCLAALFLQQYESTTPFSGLWALLLRKSIMHSLILFVNRGDVLEAIFSLH